MQIPVCPDDRPSSAVSLRCPLRGRKAPPLRGAEQAELAYPVIFAQLLLSAKGIEHDRVMRGQAEQRREVPGALTPGTVTRQGRPLSAVRVSVSRVYAAHPAYSRG